MRRSLFHHIIPGLLTAALVAGCSGPPTAKVTGKVTFRNRPLAGGVITLLGVGDAIAMGAVEADGTFTVANAPIGRVRVGIACPKPGPPPSGTPGRSTPSKAAPADPAKWFPVPDKYADPNTSGKEIEVKPGVTTADIVLE